MTAAVGAQYVSPVNYHLLTTCLGFNIEKEILDPAYADKK
jgi:hypothetical protein